MVDVDLTGSNAGDKVELDKVLLIANDSDITVGTPTIEGAKVTATSQGLIKGKKTHHPQIQEQGPLHQKNRPSPEVYPAGHQRYRQTGREQKLKGVKSSGS